MSLDPLDDRTLTAIAALDTIDPSDPEAAHGEADAILLAYVPTELRDAYNRLVAATAFWVTA